MMYRALLVLLGAFVAVKLVEIERHLREIRDQAKKKPKGERPNPLVGSEGRRGDRGRL